MCGGAEVERGTGGDADFFLQVSSEDPFDHSYSHVMQAFDFHPEHDVIKCQSISAKLTENLGSGAEVRL